jgi:hypothetical protein
MRRTTLGSAGFLVVSLVIGGCGGGGSGTPDSGPGPRPGVDPDITVQLVSPVVPIWAGTQLSLQWSSTPFPERSDVLIDGVNAAANLHTLSTTIPMSSYAEGDHHLEVQVRSGTKQATTGAIPFTVDHTPPIAEMVSPPSGSFSVGNHAPAVFRFSEPVTIKPGRSPFLVTTVTDTQNPYDQVAGTLEMDLDQRTFRFTPDGGWGQLPWPFPLRYLVFELNNNEIQDRAGNFGNFTDWYFYVSSYTEIGGPVLAAFDPWVDLASSPGGRLVMAQRSPDFQDQLLELDAGAWTAFPAIPIPDGGATWNVSMDLEGDTLYAASSVLFPGSRPPELQLHQWSDGGWQQLAGGVPPTLGEFTLAMAQDGTAFVGTRDGIEPGFAVLRATGGQWEQVGARLPTTGEAGGFPVRPMVLVDANGTPWILLLENTMSGAVAQVRRWSGLDWEAVGPPLAVAVQEIPRLGVDVAGRPVVSYRFVDVGTGITRIQVVRLENGSWNPLGEALRGHADPPDSDLETGVFLRHAMKMRDGQRPVVAFTSGTPAGAAGVAACEWLDTDWSCADNVARYLGVYGPPAVAVWSGEVIPAFHTFTVVDGGLVIVDAALGPNR